LIAESISVFHFEIAITIPIKIPFPDQPLPNYQSKSDINPEENQK